MSALPYSADRAEFLAHYGGIYENSEWIAAAAWHDVSNGKAATLNTLAAAMKQIVDEADDTKQLDLIRAHPELAGKAAIKGTLTDQSKSEQSGAGLDQCTPDEYEKFQDLNTAYNNKFGFPFIVAVAGMTREDILGAFEKRLDNNKDDEFKTALTQIHKIARLRLEKLPR